MEEIQKTKLETQESCLGSYMSRELLGEEPHGTAEVGGIGFSAEQGVTTES